ncbi:MAG: nuclear pore complex subunit [Bacteroidetes bacterium GWA2_32_17]|nr:MAG: nuclear pore complex subunit [Bacteroidetes bacterium GWA2_32_17]
MEALIIKETNDTPTITFDKENNRFEIKGKSLPENVNSFYEPVLKWLEQYFENPNPKTEFYFNLDYLNTASSKSMLSLLLILESAVTAGHKVEIIWQYLIDDEDMFDVGEEYSQIIKVPFKFESFESED